MGLHGQPYPLQHGSEKLIQPAHLQYLRCFCSAMWSPKFSLPCPLIDTRQPLWKGHSITSFPILLSHFSPGLFPVSPQLVSCATWWPRYTHHLSFTHRQLTNLNNPKITALTHQLSWSQHLLLLRLISGPLGKKPVQPSSELLSRGLLLSLPTPIPTGLQRSLSTVPLAFIYLYCCCFSEELHLSCLFSPPLSPSSWLWFPSSGQSACCWHPRFQPIPMKAPAPPHKISCIISAGPSLSPLTI